MSLCAQEGTFPWVYCSDQGISTDPAYVRAVTDFPCTDDRLLTPSKRAALAVVYYIEVFRFYVGGSNFKVRTDHRALQWLFSSKRASMYLCWILQLQPYNFEVEYRPGKFNHVLDAVPRSPIPTDPNEIDDPVEPVFLSIARPVAPENLDLSCTLAYGPNALRALSPLCTNQHSAGRRHARAVHTVYEYDPFCESHKPVRPRLRPGKVATRSPECLQFLAQVNTRHLSIIGPLPLLLRYRMCLLDEMWRLVTR